MPLRILQLRLCAVDALLQLGDARLQHVGSKLLVGPRGATLLHGAVGLALRHRGLGGRGGSGGGCGGS